MADDDTRYRIVTRRRPPTRDSAASADGRERVRRPTAPATPPAAMARGTAQTGERIARPLAPAPGREAPVTLPRRFGGVELVIEDHGDHIAVVLPGALRLVGTRDEAVALAAALLHTVERKR